MSSKSQTTMRTRRSRRCTRSTNLYASIFGALSLLTPCLVVWMHIQSQWDPCCRWRRQSSDTLGSIKELCCHSNIDWIVKLCAFVNDYLLLLTRKCQVWSVAFSPDGNILTAGCGDGHVYIFKSPKVKWAQVSYNKHHSATV